MILFLNLIAFLTVCLCSLVAYGFYRKGKTKNALVTLAVIPLAIFLQLSITPAIPKASVRTKAPPAFSAPTSEIQDRLRAPSQTDAEREERRASLFDAMDRARNEDAND